MHNTQLKLRTLGYSFHYSSAQVGPTSQSIGRLLSNR